MTNERNMGTGVLEPSDIEPRPTIRMDTCVQNSHVADALCTSFF